MEIYLGNSRESACCKFKYLVKEFEKWEWASDFKRASATRGWRRKWERHIQHTLQTVPLGQPTTTGCWEHHFTSQIQSRCLNIKYGEELQQIRAFVDAWLCSFIARDKKRLQNFTAAMKPAGPCEIDNRKKLRLPLKWYFPDVKNGTTEK